MCKRGRVLVDRDVRGGCRLIVKTAFRFQSEALCPERALSSRHRELDNAESRIEEVDERAERHSRIGSERPGDRIQTLGVGGRSSRWDSSCRATGQRVVAGQSSSNCPHQRRRMDRGPAADNFICNLHKAY
ncbi:hypothetical protein ANTPLA_LOCUS7430 [Anthophora plagiata]